MRAGLPPAQCRTLTAPGRRCSLEWGSIDLKLNRPLHLKKLDCPPEQLHVPGESGVPVAVAARLSACTQPPLQCPGRSRRAGRGVAWRSTSGGQCPPVLTLSTPGLTVCGVGETFRGERVELELILI